MSHPYLSYAITEVYCLVFALIMLFRLNRGFGSEREVSSLKRIIYAYVTMLATDAIWALMEDGILHLPVLVNAAVNAVSIAAIALGCYFWCHYVMVRLHPTHVFSKRFQLIGNLPVTIICLADVMSIFTGWMFFLDANEKYAVTDLFAIQGVVNYGYLLIATVDSAYYAFKTHSKMQRAEYVTYAVYMIAPLAAGLLEDLLPTVPVLALNIFMMILLVFLMIQNMQIYNDALTGLNNRRRLDQYLEGRIAGASKEHGVILFMMDINRFKYINDTFGHVQGDNALRLFAGALKTVAETRGDFIARYGGDEFCLVADAPESDVHEEGARIAREVSDIRVEIPECGGYQVSVSVGYAACDKPETKVDDFIAEADAMLYERKRIWREDHPLADGKSRAR